MANHTADLEPTDSLSLVVTMLLGLGIVVLIIAAASTFSEITLLREMEEVLQNEGRLPDPILRRADASDARQSAIGFAQMGAMIVTGVVFLVWVHRSSRNAHALEHGLTYSPGWSVGYYFVPIFNLFRPYQAMREIYQASTPGVRDFKSASTGLLPVWWTLWIVASVAGRVSMRMAMTAQRPNSTFDDIMAASVMDLVCSVIELPLHLVLISIVRKVHQNQELKCSRQDLHSDGSHCTNCGEPVDILMRNCKLCGEPLSTNPHWMNTP